MSSTKNEKDCENLCSKREFIEGTGYTAEKWQKLGEITPVPGYSDERIHLFMAAELKPAQQNLDRDELLHVHEVRLEEALEMIFTGDIQDSKTISGLFIVRGWLRGIEPTPS